MKKPQKNVFERFGRVLSVFSFIVRKSISFGGAVEIKKLKVMSGL